MYLTIFCVLFAGVLVCAVDQPWKKDNLYPAFPYTTFCFLIGAFTSMVAGYIGMMIATTANVKVTYLCNTNIDDGFKVAFHGGQVLGFVLVGLALLILEILILTMKGGVIGHIGEEGT
jgi:Na+/H+-translocating membrane pyrophosphatase